MQRRTRSLFTVSVVSALCLGACASSEFRLAGDSALPKWFELPPGKTRADITVTMTNYGPLFGSKRTATLTLTDRDGRVFSKLVADKVGNQPRSLVPDPGTGPIPYPMYEVLVANGQSEVVVHRRPEPLFRIESDPEVRRRLGVRD